ncbi:MAG: sulfite exporter TauE/SafE family protein [Planctomycetota bacterium]
MISWITLESLGLLGAVVAASLVGSLHCGGMCGAFVAIACGCDDRSEHARLQTLYHGGRLVGYSALGALAGSLGRAIDFGASAAGLTHAAAVLAAVTMFVVGLGILVRDHTDRLSKLRPPAFVQGLFRAGLKVSARLTPSRRALTIGLLTALLPCGWLYAFALVAAGTASPVWGVAVMGAFWVGTVPILAAVGFGVGAAHSRMGPALRTVAAVAILVLGVVTLLRVPGADLSVVRHALGAEAGAATLTGMDGTLEAQLEAAPCPLCADGEPMPEVSVEP